MTPSPGVGSSLSALGVSAEQEHLYRFLLRAPGTGIQGLAELLGTDPSALRDELAGLISTGLVELSGETLVAAAPDHALGRLIDEEARRLRAVGHRLESLTAVLPSMLADHQSAARETDGEPVTVGVVEVADVVGLISTLAATSPGDLMWLLPDYWRLPEGRRVDAVVLDLLRSGRRSRAIYPARVLEEAPEVLRARAQAGEHVRILAAVPSRLAIMGSSAALTSESWGVNSGRRLVVRQGALISALTMLFDCLWDRALPVPGLDGQAHDTGPARDRRLLLDQLAGGVKDEQIARAMGLSLRTVRRRVAEILQQLGVESRFQAGVEAVRRGWI